MKKCLKTNKTCYRTSKIAKQELAFCKMAFNNGNGSYKQTRYYKCSDCNNYHLTSNTKDK
jgi:hypothetical protein